MLHRQSSFARLRTMDGQIMHRGGCRLDYQQESAPLEEQMSKCSASEDKLLLTPVLLHIKAQIREVLHMTEQFYLFPVGY